MDKIAFDINPYTFTGSAIVIGLVLANELSTLEQSSVGNWLQLVGLTIQTYSSQQEVIASKTSSTIDTNSTDLQTIKQAISKIEEELNKIKDKKL